MGPGNEWHAGWKEGEGQGVHNLHRQCLTARITSPAPQHTTAHRFVNTERQECQESLVAGEGIH